MRYALLLITVSLLILLSWGKDLSGITSWLLGINFSFAIFSVNFTFFGYQLSRYKPILDRVSRRQWFNIVVLLVLPFIPLLTYLFSQDHFALVALAVLPVVVWSSIDNALLTSSYLDPATHLTTELCSDRVASYLNNVYSHVEAEVRKHEEYLAHRGTFQIPAHEWSFDTDLLGLGKRDLWDRVATVLKQSVANNDHPIYQTAVERAMELLLASYRYESKKKDDYRELQGLRSLSRHRFRGLSYWVLENDDEGIYFESWANRLCTFLKSEEALDEPLGPLTEGIMSDITFIGSVMLGNNRSHDPMKILNTIHAVIELSVHRIDSDEKDGKDRFLDRHNIAGYAHQIKSLGKDAILAKRYHFTYRCMETLSYLGCNAAKILSRQSVVASFEALVQLGRYCRKEHVGCFWSHCIIPLHSHAEEFMGHILTWLVRGLEEDGSFPLKACAEQAYSRLRGVECTITPRANANPAFWIEERTDEEGNPVRHVESLSGAYGYGGSVDYSNFDDLTDYRLFDFD